MTGLYDSKRVQKFIDETVADLEERHGCSVYVDSVRILFMTHNGDLIAEVDVPITADGAVVATVGNTRKGEGDLP